MSSVNVFLRDNLSTVSEKRMRIAQDIDEKKIKNALECFKFTGERANIIALLDNTLMGSGKDGLLFTGEQVIYRAAFAEPVFIRYEDIVDVAYEEKPSGKEGKKGEEIVVINLKDEGQVVLKSFLDCDYQKLAEVLSRVCSEFEEYSEEKQLITIEELSDSLKIAYLKVIVNMVFDDGQIDKKEMAEIYHLMTRLKLPSTSRMQLFKYMSDSSKLESVEQLVEAIDSEVLEGHQKAIHISLVKDLLNVHLSTSGSLDDEFPFLQANRVVFKVSDDEIDLARAAIQTDHKMLKEDVTDDQLVSAMKLLSAKAAAVGTPLAAVYLSGSVVGMSAAGITSGLASLGMGGLLGLSSMTTGIGVAVLIGVGAYAGIRKLTGANEINRSKRRELMLTEVIKQTQETISCLMQDINFITSKLNEYIESNGFQEARMKQLMTMLQTLTGAGKEAANKSDAVKANLHKIKCAKFLDVNKLRSLTRDAEKEKIFDFIITRYEEKNFEVNKDGQNQTIVKMVVKSGLAAKEVEELSKAFQAIGYFDASEVIKGSMSDAASKAKDRMAGLFS